MKKIILFLRQASTLQKLIISLILTTFVLGVAEVVLLIRSLFDASLLTNAFDFFIALLLPLDAAVILFWIDCGKRKQPVGKMTVMRRIAATVLALMATGFYIFIWTTKPW